MTPLKLQTSRIKEQSNLTTLLLYQTQNHLSTKIFIKLSPASWQDKIVAISYYKYQ